MKYLSNRLLVSIVPGIVLVSRVLAADPSPAPSDSVPAIKFNAPAPASKAGKGSADADYQAFQKAAAETPPGNPQTIGAIAYYTWVNQHGLKIHDLGMKFYESHPTDPRRWTVVVAMLGTKILFVKEFKPGFEKEQVVANVVRDTDSADAWGRQARELMDGLVAANDAPPAVQMVRAESTISRDISRETPATPKADVAALQGRIEAFAGNYPAAADPAVQMEARYLQTLGSIDPAAQKALLQKLAASRGGPFSQLAAGMLKAPAPAGKS